MRKKKLPRRTSHIKQQPVLTSIGAGSASGFGFGIGGKPLPEQLFYLVVAGGGSGAGGGGGGGGGAGGFRTNLPTQTSGGTPGFSWLQRYGVYLGGSVPWLVPSTSPHDRERL